MSGREVLACSVVVYAALPLLMAIRRSPFQFVLLYTYIAGVLTLGGLLGAVYIVPVHGDVALLAGQVSYGAFMFATLVTVVVGRDVQVVRNVIALTVAINVLVFLIFHLSTEALGSPEVLNPLGVPAAPFDQSLRSVVLGGVLIVLELLLLLAVLELIKGRLGPLPMAVAYVATFVAILALDGVLFPTLVLTPVDDLPALIEAGVKAKLVLAGCFTGPLLLFIAFYRPLLDRFESTPLHLGDLLSLSRDTLHDRLAASDETARRATATVAQIVHSATNTVLVATDADLLVTHFNTGAQQLLGYTEDEVLGRDTTTMFHTEAELAAQAALLGAEVDVRAVIRASVARGEPSDWQLLAKGGETRVVSLSLTEIRDGTRLVGYLAAGEDVTERQRGEQALADALEREHAAVERLEEADRVKDELVSTISHELRTPITSIRGYVELISEETFGDVSDEQRTALSKVMRNTARLQVLVDDLLFVARADADRLALEMVPLDLRTAVESSFDVLGELMRQRPELGLAIDLPPEPVPVTGDASALERVVVNLCGNAIKFTPGSGEVVLAVEQDGGAAVITVADTGIGIAADELDQVFGRFFRTEQAGWLAIPGSGLGLGVVQRLVTEHGGTIDITSTQGVGTTGTVRLPSA